MPSEETDPTMARAKRNLGQCIAELPIQGESNVWYCTKPEGHDGQHEATVKWGAVRG